jgi:hypothetical protein
MTKKDLIELLKDVPDDAIIDVIEEDNSGWQTSTSFVELDKEDHFDILDLRDDLHKNSPNFGKVFVQLGSN